MRVLHEHVLDPLFNLAVFLSASEPLDVPQLWRGRGPPGHPWPFPQSSETQCTAVLPAPPRRSHVLPPLHGSPLRRFLHYPCASPPKTARATPFPPFLHQLLAIPPCPRLRALVCTPSPSLPALYPKPHPPQDASLTGKWLLPTPNLHGLGDSHARLHLTPCCWKPRAPTCIAFLICPLLVILSPSAHSLFSFLVRQSFPAEFLLCPLIILLL